MSLGTAQQPRTTLPAAADQCNLKEQALTAAAGLHLMPNVSYRGAPGMMAALAGVVHERQTAAG
jgi:hypothetical protein